MFTGLVEEKGILKEKIPTGDGFQFVIEAKNNNKQNVYIQSATMNGTDYSKNYIRYSDIVNGGKLQFEMGDEPNKIRGTKDSDLPFSLSKSKE